MLTANCDVAVLPGCIWVCGKAPGSLASVWVSTIVIIQAFVRVPNTKQAEKICKQKQDLKALQINKI